MPENQYKLFRNVKQAIEGNLLTKRYDEPTYLTFRVLFGEEFASRSGVLLTNTTYDQMPHPLFNDIWADATGREGDGGRNTIEFNRSYYSTIDYLRDANEFSRGEMMKEFITMWNDLQNNFQYYFRSVEGVGELLKPAPGRGRRVPSDFRLTFNMAEGIDQRVSYLLNLYRKIAWDDTYQRWILPDMMRYFTIKIYITEFRTFHRAAKSIEAEEPTQSQQDNIYNYGGPNTFASRLKEELGINQLRRSLGAHYQSNSQEPLTLVVLNSLDKFLPTQMIECQMCEFDIENFNLGYRDNLSVVDDPTEATVSFQVKVGNVNEIQTFPLFNHYIFNDYKINGLDRSLEKGNIKGFDGRVKNDTGNEPFSVTKQGDARYQKMDETAQNTDSQFNTHDSGTAFNQSSLGAANLANSSPNAAINSAKVNPIEPATWVGNAKKFGLAFTENFITEKADKLKMAKIPGLGFSFTEAVSAIESKSFISVLGLVRKAINENVAGTQPPSSQLDDLVDSTFQDFLKGVALSEATDGDELELIKIANQALSDGGTWEAIKDFSLATNLVGPGEANKPVTIEGGNQYSQAVSLATNNDRSLATDLDGGPKFVKTGNLIGNQTLSDATNTNVRDLEGRKYSGVTDRSAATDLDGGPTMIQPGQILEAAPSSATSGRALDSNKPFQGVGEGLGNVISEKGPASQIVSEATDGDQIEKGNLTGGGGLGDSVDGGKFYETGGLSESIDGDLKTTNILSEATDGDDVENKLPQPNPSQATQNKIDNAG